MFDNAGNTISVITKTSLQTLGNGEDVVITVKQDGSGEVTSAKASVNIFEKDGKVTIDGDTIKVLTDTAGADTDIAMSVKNSDGETLYKLTVNSGDLKNGNSMKVFQYSAKKGYVIVNANTYTVSEDGDVSISLKGSGSYRLEDTKTAAKIEKQILTSIKPAKASVRVKNGESIKVALAKTFNSENAKSITFSTVDNKIVNVSKKGKVKTLRQGKAIVSVKVILNNEKLKTVKTKIIVQ